MAKYLLVYHGGSMAEGEAAQKQAMDAWGAWFGRLGSALVDGGNPASATKIIGADGAVSSGNGHSPSGYSIIQADSLDAAVTLAKGCPVLSAGATIEVVETLDVM